MLCDVHAMQQCHCCSTHSPVTFVTTDVGGGRPSHTPQRRPPLMLLHPVSK